MVVRCRQRGDIKVATFSWSPSGALYVGVGLILFAGVWFGHDVILESPHLLQMAESEDAFYLWAAVAAIVAAPIWLLGGLELVSKSSGACIAGLGLLRVTGHYDTVMALVGFPAILSLAAVFVVLNGLALLRLRTTLILNGRTSFLAVRRQHVIGCDQNRVAVADVRSLAFVRIYTNVFIGEASDEPSIRETHGEVAVDVGPGSLIPLGFGATGELRTKGRAVADFLGLPFEETSGRDPDRFEG